MFFKVHVSDLYAQYNKLCPSFYSYINDWTKLEETQLPPKEAFFNFLRKEAISDDSYAHGERVWRELGFTKMEEFCEMYLSLDILLLSKSKRCFRYD